LLIQTVLAVVCSLFSNQKSELELDFLVDLQLSQTSFGFEAINSSRSNDNAEEEMRQRTELAQDLHLVIGSFWPALKANILWNCSVVASCQLQAQKISKSVLRCHYLPSLG